MEYISSWSMMKMLKLGKNIKYHRENTEALLQANRDIILEVNTEKTKYMVVSRQQNVGQNHNLLIANKSFGNLTWVTYWETTETSQNCIQEEIKSRLNSGNA